VLAPLRAPPLRGHVLICILLYYHGTPVVALIKQLELHHVLVNNGVSMIGIVSTLQPCLFD
jgi:hypothetical protein